MAIWYRKSKDIFELILEQLNKKGNAGASASASASASANHLNLVWDPISVLRSQTTLLMRLLLAYNDTYKYGTVGKVNECDWIKSIVELFLEQGADPTVTVEWDGREIDPIRRWRGFAAYVPDPPNLYAVPPPDPPTVNMDALTIASNMSKSDNVKTPEDKQGWAEIIGVLKEAVANREEAKRERTRAGVNA